MNNRKTPISATISIVGTIIFIGCVIIGFLYGIAYGVEGSQNAKAFGGVIAVIFGMILRMGIGFLVGLPTASILWGFAKIVAWYEAVPPGHVYILQPTDNSTAPASPQPIINRSESTVPGGHAFRNRSLPVSSGSIKWWECKCGTMNSSDHMTCTSCGRANPQTDSSASAAPSAFTGCWTCSCGAQNPASQADCDACGASNPRIVR